MVEHINQCTKSNDILGEKALVQMQKHLQTMVNEYRRKESASEMKPRVTKPEEKSVADLRKSMPESSKPAFATETHNKAASMNPAEFKDIINAMTYNKGCGMTEAQWNQIVVRNAEKAKQEELSQKEKLN